MKQYHKVVPQDLIEVAVSDYNSRKKYDTVLMNKAVPGDSLRIFTPLIEQVLNKKLVFKSGNFYKHSISYLPHTDYKVSQGNTLNVVIPLWYSGDQASLIVFDQIWNLDSVTWCLNDTVHKFDVNTGVAGNPCDYPDVVGLTNSAVDIGLYAKHLSHRPMKCFYGLTGQAFPFELGSMIVFDNRHIHCTSKMSGEKLGLSLRFST
jgi:hypothetical protein